MPWQKGQSGNPSGPKPKLLVDGRSLRDLCREHTESSVKALLDIMANGDTDAARLGAANSILDRGWGKPTQSVIVDDAQGALVAALDMSGFSDQVLLELAAAKVIDADDTTRH